MLKRFFFFLLVLTCLVASAQQTRQYSFRRFSTANGLASNQVNSIVQDNDGYMWLATLNGLQRYDGNSFRTFKKGADGKGLPSDNIAALYKDAKGNLWVIGDNNKLGIFNTRTFKYKEIPVPYKNPKRTYTFKYFSVSHNGDLLLHERWGDIFKYDAANEKFILLKSFIVAPKGWSVDHIRWDKFRKKYWYACDSGFVLFDPVSKRLNYRGHNIDNDPAIKALENENQISNIFIDSKSDVLFITWPSNSGNPFLGKYVTRKHEASKVNVAIPLGLGYHELVEPFEQKNGRIWIAGHPFLSEWVNDKSSFVKVPNEYVNEQSIKFDHILWMYEDRERNMWICTDLGVFLFNPDEQIFNAYNPAKFLGNKVITKEGAVQTILETEERIYVGCWGIGLYSYDKQMNPVPLPPGLAEYQKTDGYSIWDMHRHSRTGKIWMVLQSGFVIVYDPKTRKSDYFLPAIFEKRTIRQVIEDNNGNLWFGNQGGRIVKWNYQPGASEKTGYELVGTYGIIVKLFVDDEGFIWAGTSGTGLLKIDPANNKIVKHFTETGAKNEQLNINSVSDILQYSDSTLIVITDCINLLNRKSNKIIHITANEGLPSNTALCAEKDANGILWLGMIGGLCRVNLEKKIFTVYDRQDGIAYDKFTTVGANRLQDGRMLFVTDHNFLVFDPQRLIEKTVPSKPHITAIKSGNHSFLLDSLNKLGALVLPYDKNSVSINFSALSYLKQKKLRYFFKLEKLEKEWQQTDMAGEAVYNYLPPGKYFFKVKTQNADGLSSEEVASFPIIINAPFWKTWWFYGFLILCVIGVLLWLDKQRMHRIKAVQKTRTEIAINFHKDIKTTLNNIHILSEMATMKADKDLDRSKDYIKQISEKSNKMITSMDDILWSLHPANDTMKETVFRIRKFVDALQNKNNARIYISIDDRISSLKLEMKTRHELFIIIKSLLRMIVEEGGGKETQMNIDYNKPKLVVTMLSNDSVINNNEGTQQRKEDVKRRAQEINADIEIQTDHKGMSIILLVPV